MVPLKLRLRNFMAYRSLDPPLDLSGIHIVCLAGPNGAGKSSLLDAITWALWGQARAKTDDELITLGQQEMEVELEFTLEEERFRVLRKRTRAVGQGRAGHSVLELQIADAESIFRPLTGNTLRETERAIQALLRLDYQTFINSALLLQGRADEFTLKTPGERKRVLGEVLGLSHYDQLEERAKNIARQHEMDVTLLRKEIASLETQVAQGPQLEAALQAAQARFQELQELTQAHEQAVAALQQARETRHEKEARYAEAQERVRQAEHELKDVTQRKEALQVRLIRYRKSLEQRSQIEPAWQEHQELALLNASLNQSLQELLALQREENALERQQEEARHKVITEAHLLEQQATSLREQAAAQQAFLQAKEASQTKLATLEAETSELATQRTRLQEIAARLGVLAHTNDVITQQGKELRVKVEQLGQPGASGTCPLCGTVLGPEGHQRILDEYQEELGRQRQLFRANDQEMRRLQEERQQQEQGLRRLEETLAIKQREAQRQLAVASQGLETAERAMAQLPAVDERLTQLQELIAREAYAPDAQRAVKQTRARIAALGYDQRRHQDVQQRLTALEPLLASVEELREAERELPQSEAEFLRIQEAEERWGQRLPEEQGRVTQLQQELGAAPLVDQQLSSAQQALAEAKQRERELGDELARLKVELERCATLETILASQRRELSAREEKLSIYNELAVAFGQRGVQALLIEASLPELEADANALLGPMTDNRLHIALQSQRQLRTGNLRETLDIIIADELGTRAYELYSGGEAFRINFALRIALSKLLARRAGVGLPTLIIDEGFGTQDAAGREKLVEAINAIADHFQRILVITHIEDLKEAFPVRIEVSKTVDGSKAQIVYS